MKPESTTHEELDARLPVGTVVDGRYQIVGHLGRGGFAHVYRARHVHLEREVALKVLDLPQGPNAAQFQARFLQEAKIAARIKHPNVVDVSDFGVPADLGQAYIAMDLLEGHDLEAELVRHGPLAPTRAFRLFDDCLAALAEGHRLGIVHKDLKPTNLFLRHPGTAAERLVILDFGIARVFGDESTHMTQTGGFAGTPAYLAPEYIERQHVTPALDVYQMGLILIESLTAQPAVMANTSMAYLIAHCQGQVQMPAALESSAVGAVLRRATHLDPAQRFADASELREALVKVDPATLPAAGAVRMEQGFGNRGRLDSVAAQAPTVVHITETKSAPQPDNTTPLPTPAEVVDESRRLKFMLAALLLVIVLGSVAAIALLARKTETVMPDPATAVTNAPEVIPPEVAPAKVAPPVVVEAEPIEPEVAPARVAPPEVVEPQDAQPEVTKVPEPVVAATPKLKPTQPVEKKSPPVESKQPVLTAPAEPKVESDPRPAPAEEKDEETTKRPKRIPLIGN